MIKENFYLLINVFFVGTNIIGVASGLSIYPNLSILLAILHSFLAFHFYKFE